MNAVTEPTLQDPPLAASEGSARIDGSDRSSASGSHGLDTAAATEDAAATGPVRLGRYEILRMLGEGGMGTVFLACQPRCDELVAIKVISPSRCDDVKTIRRFLQEARNMRRMNHPHILPVYEVCADGWDPGDDDRASPQVNADQPREKRPHQSRSPYYVMKYVAHGSLARRIRRGGGEPISHALALRVAIQIAEALAYAHDRMGLAHRDIKPENVLIDDDRGHCYLADFGLLRSMVCQSVPDSLSGVRNWTVGTGPYIAPEIARGEAGDVRADIYSFGGMVYEMVTSCPPYDGDSTADVLAKILDGPPEPVRSRNASVSAGLAAVIEGAMGRELRDRYARITDVLDDLRRLDAGLQPLGPRGSADEVVEIRQSEPDANAAPEMAALAQAAPPYLRRRSLTAISAGLVIAACAAYAPFMARSPRNAGRPAYRSASTDAVFSVAALATAVAPARSQSGPNQSDAPPPRAIPATNPSIAPATRTTFPDAQDLMDAVANGRIERVRLLLAAGADTGAWDALGNTPLHVAAARGDSQIVSALLGAGAIRANQPSRGTGRTPLHEAAFYRHLDVIRLLLDGGADVNARDRGRQTPLHVAAACGSADVVALLLRLGADSTAHDDKGHTPADLAAAKATESARPDEGFRAVLALLNQP